MSQSKPTPTKQDIANLQAFIASLPPRSRRVFTTLGTMGNRARPVTPREIARHLDVEPQSVSLQIASVRNRLSEAGIGYQIESRHLDKSERVNRSQRRRADTLGYFITRTLSNE